MHKSKQEQSINWTEQKNGKGGKAECNLALKTYLLVIKETVLDNSLQQNLGATHTEGSSLTFVSHSQKSWSFTVQMKIMIV